MKTTCQLRIHNLTTNAWKTFPHVLDYTEQKRVPIIQLKTTSYRSNYQAIFTKIYQRCTCRELIDIDAWFRYIATRQFCKHTGYLNREIKQYNLSLDSGETFPSDVRGTAAGSIGAVSSPDGGLEAERTQGAYDLSLDHHIGPIKHEQLLHHLTLRRWRFIRVVRQMSGGTAEAIKWSRSMPPFFSHVYGRKFLHVWQK